jgi:hypothetical protein
VSLSTRRATDEELTRLGVTSRRYLSHLAQQSRELQQQQALADERAAASASEADADAPAKPPSASPKVTFTGGLAQTSQVGQHCH